MAPPSENSGNSSEKDYRSSIQKTAESHVDEILARRERARATRAAALASHAEPISIKTELTRVRLTGGVTAAAAAPTERAYAAAAAQCSAAAAGRPAP